MIFANKFIDTICADDHDRGGSVLGFGTSSHTALPYVQRTITNVNSLAALTWHSGHEPLFMPSLNKLLL